MTKAIPNPAKTLFPEWAEKHQADEAYPRIINEMWALHGKTPGQTCGGCKLLHHCGTRSSGYYKCEKTRVTHGTATDFRISWPACGLHQPQEKKL